MSTNIIYDAGKHSYKDIIQLNSKGAVILCPICHSRLLIIDSKELTNKYKKPQGIFCPKNHNHVWIKFILTEERNQFWKKVEERIKKNSENEV